MFSQCRFQTPPCRYQTKYDEKGWEDRKGYGERPVGDCEWDPCPDVLPGQGRLDGCEEGEDCARYNGEEMDYGDPVIVTPYYGNAVKL